MKVRLMLAPVAVALGMGLPVAVSAADAVKMAGNQALADTVAQKIMSSATAQGADVSIVAQNGVVTVTGTCKDAAQKAAVLQDVRTTAGVKLVKDGIVMGSIQQVQATSVPPIGPVAGPAMFGQPPAPGAGMVEPTPLGAAGMGAMNPNAPPLPPYAWPTYAPYGNISRVGYPTAYPYNAFPFIGPYYPFPKVPMGWRTVQLKWEDGFWWYGKQSAPHDYWRVRFW
ncbi:MAG TPA: BON domain-containing protein [Fimbriiglobus sp.]